MIGQTISHYRILEKLGAGGMGEVYKAHDTKLGRDVAIKILPEAFARDPERLARFQREAKMLASMNHTNIATIHGLEHSNGTNYLVMELVAGETLAERVKREGPVPVEEALKIAVQIAEALEVAHEKGIIHRDLKPANVKITPEGKVKVLDFGLAKAFAGEGGQDLSQAPTVTALATAEGRILGTPAYMSPEQARGKAVDKRTDIWAFGCVLYELLTGKRAFRGETAQDTIAAILEREPDWQALPAASLGQILSLLRRCLRRDQSLRLRDAGDVRIEIQEALTTPATDAKIVIASPPLTKRWRLPALGLAGMAVLALAVIAIWDRKPVLPQPVTRTVITLPPGQRLAGSDQQTLALSPDGTHLAYVAIQGGIQQIYLRAMDSTEAKPVSGTEGASNPFFSPDGRWVGFFSGNKLKKVSVNGGAALSLADAPQPRGASWGGQGIIVFAPTALSVLQQVSDAGGAPRPLIPLGKGENSQRWPEFLPGNRTLLFASGTAVPGIFVNPQVAVQPVATDDRRNVIKEGTLPHYAPSGHLVYAQGGNLMAIPFSPQRLTATGAAVPVVEGVLQSPVTGAAQYSFSATGSLVYVSGGIRGAESKLVWVNRKGAEQPLAAPARDYESPRLSPDGKRIAVATDGHIWLYDLSRETLTRLTFEGNLNNRPVWTTDGKRIAFVSNKEGPQNLYWQLADGSGGPERLTTSDDTQTPNSWSPDGQSLAFLEVDPATGLDIWILRLDDRKAQPFLRTRFNEGGPRFSPDGRWLAYISDESGRFETYVQPYAGSGGKWQISTEGGTEPVWSPNGRELFYRNGDKMMAVDIVTQPTFSAGKPHVLFEGRYQASPLTASNYDVSSDGQRLLMLKAIEQTQGALTQINVVQNWFEELKRRVPTGK